MFSPGRRNSVSASSKSLGVFNLSEHWTASTSSSDGDVLQPCNRTRLKGHIKLDAVLSLVEMAVISAISSLS